VRPSLAIALLWPLIACVATNPAWDGPAVSDDESGSSGDRIATGEHGSSAGSTVADDAGTDETTAPDETTVGETTVLPMEGDTGSGSGDATSSESGGVGCAHGEWVCHGECVDASRDKRACGFFCVDCTALFGNNARCELGSCRPHGGGDGD
jgi:hypothetical protein